MPGLFKCRRCAECQTAKHHWIDDGDSLTGTSCKHCPAIGVECMTCAGTGGFDPCCVECLGDGITEVVRTELVRLDEVRRLVASGDAAGALEILNRILQ